ncbi:MAG: cobalamin-binding protein [Gemmatimonadota bacterium]
MKIVSLLASATEIVDLLGGAEDLVGISHECDYPAHVLDRPRLSRARFDPQGLDSGELDQAVRDAMRDHGSVYELDESSLVDLDPDLILTQAVCEVCAVPTAGVREVVNSAGLRADVLSLDSHSLAEILATVEAVGTAIGRTEPGRALADELRARTQAVRSRVQGAARPRVLGLEWLSPPFTPGHWVPEMIEVAGGQNLVGDPASRSRQVRWEDVEHLDPDVLVIMPCGYGLPAARADADAHASRLARVAPRAIENGRAFVVDASAYFNRSGPRVLTGIETLAAILHPDLFGPLNPSAAKPWTPDRP